MDIIIPIILSGSNIRMLDCIIKEDKLIDYALELGLTGVAITDHESVSGYIKALKYMQSLKSKAKKILEIEPNDKWANQVKNFKLVFLHNFYGQLKAHRILSTYTLESLLSCQINIYNYFLQLIVIKI